MFQDGQPGLSARDLWVFSMLWKQPSVTGVGDLTGDRLVDHHDLILLLYQFQQPEASESPTAAASPTPTVTSTATATPTATSTPSATSLPTITHTPTPANTSENTTTDTPTPTATVTIEAGVTATPTPSATPDNEGRSTPTIAPGDVTNTPTATPTAFVLPPSFTPTVTPSNTATPTVLSVEPRDTPTPSDPGATPTPSIANGGGDDPTPTVTPVSGTIPDTTEEVFVPDFVRLWNINRPLTLFTKPVELPSGNRIASSTNGYAVYTLSLTNAPEFIAFDRFGRIFRRTFPLFSMDYSSLDLVDGGDAFGQFFESPSDTRRFQFERFNLDRSVMDAFQVDHLGADAIGWAFGGGERGYAMAVLRFPNIITLHLMDQNGSDRGSVDIQTEALPLSPKVILTVFSGEKIAVMYSSDPDPISGSILPLTVWIFDLEGNVFTEEPVQIDLELERDLFVGDGQGWFYFMGRGSRLLRLDENGIALDKVLAVGIPAGMRWQDDLLWVLDGPVHSLRGYTEEAVFHTGPVDVFPPGWDSTVDWVTLRKSSGDLGGFFTDPQNPNAIHYLQIEQGPLVTPTPLPAPGVPTGATIEVMLNGEVGMELVLVPKGSYLRGSPEDEAGRNRNNEGPQHSVRIRDDFFLGKYEVTMEQYRVFDPGYRAPGFNGKNIDGATNPVVGIGWEQAEAFCDWLSEQTGSTFRLPTEGEWEYACRAGTTARRYWGDDLENSETCQYANAADISAVTELNFISGFPCEDGFVTVAPVGSYPSNPFGLHDMLGNVSEWCRDWFGLYPSGAQVDPQGPPRGSSKIIRGGSWSEGPDLIRSARRGGLPLGEIRASIAPFIGFRVVQEVD